MVSFHGEERPVCRMHQATYARWGDDAETQAEALWEWTPTDRGRLDRAPVYR